MRKLIFILILTMLLCGSVEGATKIGLDRLNWSQSLPSGEGITFSGTAPASTTGVLYSDSSGTLKFGTSTISGRIEPFEAQIMKDGANTVLIASNGTKMLSSTNSGGVINWAINHSYHSIYVHSGNYTITESVDLRARKSHLHGAGKETIFYGSISPIVNIKNSGSYYNDVSLSNLFIKGAGNQAYDAVWIGWLALNVKLMDSIWIENCKEAIWIGDTSFGNDYYSLDISKCYRGIYMNATSLVTTQRFFGGSIRECTLNGIRIRESTAGNLFQGMIIEYNGDNTNPDVYLSCDTDPLFVQGNVFRDCWFEDNTMVFAIGGSQTNSWLGPYGNVVESCHFALMADNVVAYRVNSGRRNAFKGNILDRSGYKGLVEILGAYAVSNIVVENVDSGEATNKWVLTDTATSTVSTPNYWN